MTGKTANSTPWPQSAPDPTPFLNQRAMVRLDNGAFPPVGQELSQGSVQERPCPRAGELLALWQPEPGSPAPIQNSFPSNPRPGCTYLGIPVLHIPPTSQPGPTLAGTCLSGPTARSLRGNPFPSPKQATFSARRPLSGPPEWRVTGERSRFTGHRAWGRGWDQGEEGGE